MRKERRGLESARHVVRRRRIEACGSWEEMVEKVEEELDGRNWEVEEVDGVLLSLAVASEAFKRFRRRCGGSDVSKDDEGVVDGNVGSSAPARMGTVSCRLRNVVLAEKYSRRHVLTGFTIDLMESFLSVELLKL